MYRLKMFIISILLLTTIVGCSVLESQELIRVADHTSGFTTMKEINSEKDIAEINQIVENIEWSDNIKLIEQQEDYQFWLEREEVQERIYNFEIWFNDNETVIFDKNQGKYGTLNFEDSKRLLFFLK